MTDALGRVLAGRPRNTLRIERVKVQAVSPLTVVLASGATVPGLAITGLTYTVGGAGVAFLSEGMIPVVLPTL